MRRPIHILHSLFTNELGGTERHVAELANAQIALGHQVTVMLRGKRVVSSKEDAFLSWLDPQVKVICLPQAIWWRRWPYLPIWWKLRELKPDIIHTHHGRDSRYLAKLSCDIPVVASLHMRYREKDYKRHDGLICVSNWQLKTIPQAMRDHTVLIPNWVKPCTIKDKAKERQTLRKQLGVSDDTLLFGSVGRLSPEKAPDTLIEAFLTADIPGSHLAIFGSGELLDSLKQKTKDEPRISLMGYEKRIRPWYEAFDVFVLPSREESFGLVLLEAMEGGCPIVTTRTDGALDLLGDNSQVIMAEIASPISLSHALKRVSEFPRERISYPELEMHSVETSSGAVMRFYERFLEK
jgi:glycosyltransferase involved in cell wall biosynthesis